VPFLEALDSLLQDDGSGAAGRLMKAVAVAGGHDVAGQVVPGRVDSAHRIDDGGDAIAAVVERSRWPAQGVGGEHDVAGGVVAGEGVFAIGRVDLADPAVCQQATLPEHNSFLSISLPPP
jgi:hypothetical protein